MNPTNVDGTLGVLHLPSFKISPLFLSFSLQSLYAAVEACDAWSIDNI